MWPWFTIFETSDPTPDFPQLLNMAHAVETSGYGHRGIDRQNDPYAAFQYTLSGCGEVIFDGKRYEVTPGQAMLFCAADPRIAYQYPSDASEPWEFIYVDILGLNEKISALTTRFGPIFTLSPNAPALDRFLSFRRRPTGHTRLSSAESAQIAWDLVNLCHFSATEPQNDETEQNRFYQQICELVDQNLAENPQIQDLAQWLEISREHLSRRFKKQTGQSLQQFIIHRKIIKICELLLTTPMTLKEIGRQTGIHSAQHLSALFKQQMGISPRQFRQSGDLNRLHQLHRN